MSADASVVERLSYYRSVLMVKPSSLGDIIHALPVAWLIKQAHPRLPLRWIANTEWVPLLEGCDFIDEVIPFPRKSFRGLAGAARFARWAFDWNRSSRAAPEIAFDLQGLFRSALISLTRGADCVIGMSDSRECASLFCDHVVDVSHQLHAVDRCLESVRALGIAFSERDIKFPLPEGRAPVGFDAREPFVILHPFSRGAGKSLAPEVLHTLCECLATIRVVLVGVCAQPHGIQGGNVTDLTNRTTLPELVWLMRHAMANVSVDSGPMHIAAAVNERTLGIHHWSDPAKVGPYPAAAWIWKAGRIAHRADFSPEEREAHTMTSIPEARRIADFILGTLVVE